ncbi:hypothetical protein MMC09_006214 [Bachmanniomyces sp. S44760]|nr:hypothetical protein [Bachmanniomyces sp. S44760]
MSGQLDPEEDAQMHSSSDENDSDALFPSSNDPPSTFGQNALLSPSHQYGELSPPNSQGHPSQNEPGSTEISTEVGEQQSHMELDSKAVEQAGPDEEIEPIRNGPQQPGWAWKNPKAMDEYHRAMEHVVDKSFSLREFGDPFDESEGKDST